MENKLVVFKKEDTENIERSLAKAEKYNAFIIKTSEDYKVASVNIKDAKSQYKIFDDREKEITKPLNVALKSTRDLFRPVKTALESAEIWLKNQLNIYEAEQQRISDEINKKAQEAADKKAKELREKAEKERKAGNVEKAAKLEEKAEEKSVFVPTVKADIPKIDGLHSVEKWYAEVIDIILLDRKYMIANDDMLGKIATATKGTLEIAGVRFFSKKIQVSGKG